METQLFDFLSVVETKSKDTLPHFVAVMNAMEFAVKYTLWTDADIEKYLSEKVDCVPEELLNAIKRKISSATQHFHE